MVHRNLKKLQELTATLPDFTELVQERAGNMITMIDDSGNAKAFGLFQHKNISIAHGVISEGVILNRTVLRSIPGASA